jgi:hypothetical protein
VPQGDVVSWWEWLVVLLLIASAVRHERQLRRLQQGEDVRQLERMNRDG